MYFLNIDHEIILDQAKKLEEIRRFKHDYKNKIFGLKTLLEAGEYSRAKEYLNTMEDEFVSVSSQSKITSFSDNIIVDAVLQNLASNCQNNGIEFYFSATVTDSLKAFSDNDICNLFCNLANNAFEATNKYTGTPKSISVLTGIREKWLVITIENTFDGKLNVEEDGTILTSKTDKDNHGFGIKSIKEILQKVPGSVYKTEPIYEENIFKTLIFIPR